MWQSVYPATVKGSVEKMTRANGETLKMMLRQEEESLAGVVEKKIDTGQQEFLG